MNARLSRVEADGFGPLSIQGDFHAGLVAVYGPNEAGKTSLLEALLSVLFGTALGNAKPFPGADRFAGSGRVSVTLDVDGRAMHFPPRDSRREDADLFSLLDLPRDPHLARMFFVREGDLELVASPQERRGQRKLLDTVCGQIFADEVKIEKVAELLRAAGEFVPLSDEWQRAAGREVEQLAQQAADLRGALVPAQRLHEIETTVASLRGKRLHLRSVEEQSKNELAAASLAEVEEVFRGYEGARDGLAREFVRASEDDEREWNEAESARVHADADVERLRGESVRLRGEEDRGERALSDARSAEADARDRHPTLLALRDAVGRLEAARASVEAARARLRSAPLYAGAAALAAVALAVVAYGAGFPALWALPVLAAGGLAVALRRASVDAAVVSGDEASWAARGREAIASGLSADPRLWSGELEAKLALWPRCEEQRAALERTSASLRSAGESARASLEVAEARAREASRRLADVRERSGEASLDSLRARLAAKRAARARLEAAAAQLTRMLAGRTEDAWRSEIAHRRSQLPERKRAPRARPEIEAGQAEVRVEVMGIESALAGHEREAEELKTRVLATGLRSAPEIARRIEELTEERGRRVRRHAAAWLALGSLDRLRRQRSSDLERALKDGAQSASRLFELVSARYKQVLFDHEGFVAVRRDGAEVLEDELSTGARAQLLLAVRISLVQRMLGGHTAFLVLDDPCLPFDRARKGRAVEMLKAVAASGWQIVYLTTDDATRDLLAAAGARVFELPLNEAPPIRRGRRGRETAEPAETPGAAARASTTRGRGRR